MQTSDENFLTVERRHRYAKTLTGSSLSVHQTRVWVIKMFTFPTSYAAIALTRTLHFWKKVDFTHKVIIDTQVRLTKERGETVTKRGSSSEIGETTASSKTNTGARSKRISLFPEAINNPTNPTERSKLKDQGTQTEEESSLASVSVSRVFNLYLVKIVRKAEIYREAGDKGRLDESDASFRTRHSFRE